MPSKGAADPAVAARRLQETQKQAKVCSMCQLKKSYEEFPYSVRAYDQLYYICRGCCRIRNAEAKAKWRLKNAASISKVLPPPPPVEPTNLPTEPPQVKPAPSAPDPTLRKILELSHQVALLSQAIDNICGRLHRLEMHKDNQPTPLKSWKDTI